MSSKFEDKPLTKSKQGSELRSHSASDITKPRIRKNEFDTQISETDLKSDTKIFDIKGFDIHAMLQLCKQIKEKTLKNLGGFIGPVVMPRNYTNYVTVLRAPHVYKRSMDKYCMLKYKLYIAISKFSQVADTITSISIPHGISVEMKKPKARSL